MYCVCVCVCVCALVCTCVVILLVTVHCTCMRYLVDEKLPHRSHLVIRLKATTRPIGFVGGGVLIPSTPQG